MEEKHRSAIQKNFVSLVERTDLDKMVAALYEKGVFSHEMISPYNETSKDARTRKRLLYVDITRRGPRAFGHLLDALSEAGYWDIVRDLDPNSSLHFRPQSTISSKSDESNFVSIRNEKKKTKNGVGPNKNHVEDLPNPAPHEDSDESDPLEIPKFNVVKSTKFMEVSDDDGSKIKLYPTRGWNRGYLVVFSYIKFKENTDKHRAGADVDCKNLKYLFAELGMKVVCYQNLTRQETLDALDSLQRVSDGECVFIVVSSHGYARAGTDVDVRCSDGSIISIFEFIDHFSDLKFPALRGIPKVFIFQICRGPNGQSESKFFTDGQGIPHASPQAQRDPPSAHQLPPPAKQLPPPNTENNRIYSDILIAQSTLPGFVSYRDRKKGSWYIQVLCDVFAARAHDTHVEELFGLVDTELHKNYRVQTSERSNWGFNRRLYLHPGLYEGPPPMNQPTSHPAS